MRMSWIESEWESKYIQCAKDTILRLVSTTRFAFPYLKYLSLQMNRYRGQNLTVTDAPSNSPVKPSPVIRSSRVPTRFKVQSSVYEKKPSQAFTVEAEYRKYVSGVTCSERTDILWFWEVRILYFEGGLGLQLTS